MFFALTAHAQRSPGSSQSTVRFRISYGANFFGDIDVQLFDQDKPATVSNFLAYARNDQYRNTLLQRCVPGTLLEGGEWTVTNPVAAIPLESLTRVLTNGVVPNEFHAGPVRSNLFGTLAMGKPPGATNSAVNQWFFNLGNNSDGSGATNFDTANGGYTVFGEVIAGTNVLEFFNSLSENLGLLNMTNVLYQGFCPPVQLWPDGIFAYPFEALPVAFTNGFGCPFYSDLFTVQVLVLSGPDSSPPRLTITSPAANISLTNQDVLVRGTVVDNVGVASVRIYWTGGGSSPLPATITNNNWSLTLTNVPPGTNTVLVEAIDRSGLRTQLIRSFFRSVRVPLTVQILGRGTVSGPTNQQMLEVGRGYTLSARPDKGNLFGGWDGDFPQADATLIFLMGPNTSVTAVFATNLFPGVKGSYQGLFFDPLLVEQISSGYLMLTVNSVGSYTAKLLMNGRTYRTRGSFQVDGRTTNVVLRPGTNALQLRIALDLNGATDQLTGVITNNQVTNLDLSLPWSASLQADRTTFDARTNPAPWAGLYTLGMPGDPLSASGPGGDSVATISVTTRGTLSFNARLADGTVGAQRTLLTQNGQWPLFLAWPNEKGVLVGWLTFDLNQPTTDISGLINWFKPSQSKPRYYPDGFTNETAATGSRYIAPAIPAHVLALTNASIAFAGGDLSADFSSQVTFEDNGRVTNQSTNRLSLSIAKADGSISGSVTPPASTRSLLLRGVVLQKSNVAAGFFLGTNVSGRVSLSGQ
ncbi:MAG TPA: peptidylprolyl isomerase [Verrucomicrobiae bacterium]|nr:peptidylprolyl isomerase [Verrucomicrobiae bacterium]